jgi:hypothetical protein
VRDLVTVDRSLLLRALAPSATSMRDVLGTLLHNAADDIEVVLQAAAMTRAEGGETGYVESALFRLYVRMRAGAEVVEDIVRDDRERADSEVTR